MSTFKHGSGFNDDAAVTITANSAGVSTTLGVVGPKRPNCPYPRGAGRYIKEAIGVYRFVEHVNLGASGTEPTGYTAEAI